MIKLIIMATLRHLTRRLTKTSCQTQWLSNNSQSSSPIRTNLPTHPSQIWRSLAVAKKVPHMGGCRNSSFSSNTQLKADLRLIVPVKTVRASQYIGQWTIVGLNLPASRPPITSICFKSRPIVWSRQLEVISHRINKVSSPSARSVGKIVRKFAVRSSLWIWREAQLWASRWLHKSTRGDSTMVALSRASVAMPDLCHREMPNLDHQTWSL